MASPVVYFVAAGDRIKIGHTSDLQMRLQALRVASADPLELLASVRAPRRAETALHSLLSEYRIGGEWFRDCAEVRGAMERFVAGDFNAEKHLNQKRPIDENVFWAGTMLRSIVEPRKPDETTRDLIVRAASLLGIMLIRLTHTVAKTH